MFSRLVIAAAAAAACLVLSLAASAAGPAPAVASASAGAGAARVTLAPASGPPGARVRISGSGFAAGASVAVLFDRTRVLQVLADGVGALAGGFAVPLSAQPGWHQVSAIGNGALAQARFLVNANWWMFRGGASHLGWNQFE